MSSGLVVLYTFFLTLMKGTVRSSQVCKMLFLLGVPQLKQLTSWKPSLISAQASNGFFNLANTASECRYSDQRTALRCGRQRPSCLWNRCTEHCLVTGAWKQAGLCIHSLFTACLNGVMDEHNGIVSLVWHKEKRFDGSDSDYL